MSRTYIITTKMNGSSLLAIHQIFIECNIDTVEEPSFRFLDLV